eukprot:sb/3470953/
MCILVNHVLLSVLFKMMLVPRYLDPQQVKYVRKFRKVGGRAEIKSLKIGDMLSTVHTLPRPLADFLSRYWGVISLPEEHNSYLVLEDITSHFRAGSLMFASLTLPKCRRRTNMVKSLGNMSLSRRDKISYEAVITAMPVITASYSSYNCLIRDFVSSRKAHIPQCWEYSNVIIIDPKLLTANLQIKNARPRKM